VRESKVGRDLGKECKDLGTGREVLGFINRIYKLIAHQRLQFGALERLGPGKHKSKKEKNRKTKNLR